LGEESELISSGKLKRFAESIARFLDDVALLDLEKEVINFKPFVNPAVRFKIYEISFMERACSKIKFFSL